jgi:4'-phosphopantetheinyl transferase
MNFPPLPNDAEIHLWWASLLQERDSGSLSQEERERGERLLAMEKRNLFIASRGILRGILSSYLGIGPEEVRIAIANKGKPYIKHEDTTGGLTFNLSHSGDLMLVAISSRREIGVDLEAIREELEFRGMAERYFSKDEKAELFSLPEEEQLEAFYRCWTRKEAYLKGCGSGFSLPSDSFRVSLLPGAAAITETIDTQNARPWQLMEIKAPPGYIASLATDRGVAAIQTFSWGSPQSGMLK